MPRKHGQIAGKSRKNSMDYYQNINPSFLKPKKRLEQKLCENKYDHRQSNDIGSIRIFLSSYKLANM